MKFTDLPVHFKTQDTNMADSKSAKRSKSKSSNNHVKLSSNSQVTASTSKGAGAVAQPNEAFKPKPRPIVPGSILDKLNLEQLKERALRNMRKGANCPIPVASREAVIEYVLDMVIGNLILNGHLDVNKAQKMRNPLMKSQIAALCEDMISAKTKISNASHAKYYRGRQKSTTKSKSKSKTRSRSKTQKWAIQPASLPITIVTDEKNLSKLSNFTTTEKMNLGMKETGSKRSLKNASSDNIKKQKSSSKQRTKSLDSSSNERSSSSSKNVSKPQPQNSPSMQSDRTNVYRQQASSEVPSSNHSLENNLKLLSSTNNVAESTTSKVKIAQKPEPGQASSSSIIKQVDDNKNIVSSTSSIKSKSEDKKESKKVTIQEETPTEIPASDKTPVSTVVPVTACLPAVPSSRTLNTFISNGNCSVPSTASTGYQILVDMKGFQNDEISMEVEGRQLIFIASRPRRGEANVRKVTEIVDVPAKVNMENLKIGRRMDGYVLIEEHES